MWFKCKCCHRRLEYWIPEGTLRQTLRCVCLRIGHLERVPMPRSEHRDYRKA